MSPRIEVDRSLIAAFCRKWKINEFSLFGSVLRDDFGPHSDVDVLIGFEAGTEWSLLDLVDMREELQGLFHRSVDLLTRRGVESSKNWLRRRAILSHTELIYAT